MVLNEPLNEYSIRDRLATVRGRVSGTSATVEPRVLQPQDGADQRRGDIKVSKHGNTCILDVGVVCPGTQRYVDQGSGTTPGLAAEAYAAVKVAKYADQDNFFPFILLAWRQVVASTKQTATRSRF
jgi:hypothetical protein